MGKFNLISEKDELIMQVIMRYAWPLWSGKKEALKRTAYYVVEAGRRRRYWKCEACGRDKLGVEDRQIDHVLPRTPVTGFDNINDWLDRTLCPPEDLACLCRECHKEKSAKEAAERAEHRRAKKLKARKAKKKTRKVKRSKK